MPWNFSSSLKAKDDGKQVLPHIKERWQHRHIHAGLAKGEQISLWSRLSPVSSLDQRKLMIHSQTKFFQVHSQEESAVESEGGAFVPPVKRRGCQEKPPERRGCLAEGEADTSLPAGGV